MTGSIRPSFSPRILRRQMSCKAAKPADADRPEPSLVIWDILLAKCLGQLIQGFSCDVSAENLLYKFCL